MGLLIDTNLFVAAERARQADELAAFLAQLPEDRADEEALISVITASELQMGIHRAVDERVRERRRNYVEALFERFEGIPIDMKVARTHAHLVADLMKRGETIGTHDSWIAATALTYNYAMVTANAREFRRVEGVEVIEIDLGR